MNDERTWDLLVERHLRDELDEEQQHMLAHRLDSDTEFARWFVDRVTWHAWLADSLNAAAAEKAGIEFYGQPEVSHDGSGYALPRDKAAARHSWGRSAMLVGLPWAIAAGLLMIVALRSIPSSSEVQQQVPQALAVLVDEFDASFVGGAHPADVKFFSGRYHLQHGEVRLRFLNGVDAVVKGPAMFRLDSLSQLTLQSGCLWARVPATVEGWNVVTPNSHLKSYAAELDLRLGDEGDVSHLSVVDGEVNVLHRKERRLQTKVSMGESIALSKGVIRPVMGIATGRPALSYSIRPAPSALSAEVDDERKVPVAPWARRATNWRST
jgi:hypothetical protein